jgi:hypothetical protein
LSQPWSDLPNLSKGLSSIMVFSLLLPKWPNKEGDQVSGW